MCKPDMVWIPKQEKTHNKRCLLDGTYDGTSIIPDSIHKHEHSEVNLICLRTEVRGDFNIYGTKYF